MGIPSTRKAAHWYAEQGWKILPMWPVYGGRCACGNPRCAHPGKHPVGHLANNGKDDATTDPEQIDVWWGQRSDWNIATASYLRLDVDTKDNGVDNWRELVADNGGYNATPTCRTPSGGMHVYFRAGEDYGHSCQKGRLPAGIEVKGEGSGSTHLPPSNHFSGGRYAWGQNSHPREVAVAVAPPWLVALIGKDGEHGDQAAFSGSMASVDTEALKVSALVKALLAEDRSRIDACVVTSLVAAGLSNDEIRAVFIRSAPTDKYASKNGQGDNYLALTIGKARAWLKRKDDRQPPTYSVAP